MTNRTYLRDTRSALVLLALSATAMPAPSAAGQAQVTPPGKAGRECLPLLVVSGGAGFERFQMTNCDVSFASSDDANMASLTLRMKEGIAGWWRQFFSKHSLADGDPVYVSPSDDESVPSGVLIDSDSADLKRPVWQWDRAQGTLTLKGAAPHYHAHLYRVCDSATRGAKLFLAMPAHIATGELFSAALRKQVPRGMRGNLPKSCVTGWTVSPGGPAFLHPEWGIGMVHAGARDGDRFTVQARVGTTVLTREVRVYEPDAHPLRGFWRQVGERTCDGGELRKPAVPISEFRLRPDGSFDLTWIPRNHHYIDYTGTYVHRRDTGEFSWKISGGQGKPTDAGSTGRARINEAGQLVITDLHPGSDMTASVRLCELVFERYPDE